jgi:type II secretory pathway component PulF
MPTYAFKAKHGPDQIVEGEVVADSRAAAASRIEAMGHSPVWIELAAARHRAGAREGARTRDVNVFTRQLAGLMRAGVPILRALATIREQTESRELQAILEELVATVRDGRMLSEGLARYPAVFPDLYINMVRSGESGGVLDEILLRLAEAREKDEELRARIRAALAYPSLVLAVGAASVLVIVTFFLPRLTRLFEGSPYPLPLPTRVVLAVGRGVARSWVWLAGAAGLGYLLGGRLVGATRRRAVADALALRVPWVGRLVRDADWVRFSRTLALLLRAGIPIQRSLALSGGVLANGLLREAVAVAGRETVMSGSSLAAALRRRPRVPAFVANMVGVGEESGQIETALEEVAAFYQRELDHDLRLLTTLLEPLLMLVIGAVIGFIIFAMLMPIFQIGQALG